jgi:hypothetical protein
MNAIARPTLSLHLQLKAPFARPELASKALNARRNCAAKALHTVTSAILPRSRAGEDPAEIALPPCQPPALRRSFQPTLPHPHLRSLLDCLKCRMNVPSPGRIVKKRISSEFPRTSRILLVPLRTMTDSILETLLTKIILHVTFCTALTSG